MSLVSLKNSCIDCVNFEFKSESLGLNHDHPKDFIQSQWPFNKKIYVVYRILMAVVCLVWFTVDILYETRDFFNGHTYYYFIYATNWSFLLIVMTSLFMAVCNLYYTVKYGEYIDGQTFQQMPKVLMVQWMLQNISYNSAIVVTISFWSYIGVLDRAKVLRTPMSYVKHSLNTAYVLLDVIISGSPYRILHLLYTVGIGSVYSLFNAIYFLNDGTIFQGRHYAYSILDWGKPPEAIVTCVLCLVLCVFAQIILYELHKIRVLIYTKFFSGQIYSKPDSEMEGIVTDTAVPAYQSIEEGGYVLSQTEEHE